MREITKIKNLFVEEIGRISSPHDLEAARVKYFGRKGLISQLPRKVDVKTMSGKDRREFGRVFNLLKEFAGGEIEKAKSKLEGASLKGVSEDIDITLPGSGKGVGSLHPVSLVQMELENIFSSMGFVILTGYEVETEHYNFDSLNTSPDHPARDMQDTYWLTNGMLLRTQTSASQVRALEKYGAPLRAIFPGRCFRRENLDPGHENTFYQLEGLMVDKDISIANLIAVMKILLNGIFHREVDIRLRHGYFPFVEPGFELDIKCLICDGKGCSTCKESGWVELLPCGLVHPNVLKNGGVDSEKWSGFAFGLGLTRLAMMKYKIPDIRAMNSGDIRILGQFPAAI